MKQLDCGEGILNGPYGHISRTLYCMAHCLCSGTSTLLQVWFKTCKILTKCVKDCDHWGVGAVKNKTLRQYLLLFSLECFMFSSVKLTLFLLFCVVMKFGMLCEVKKTN